MDPASTTAKSGVSLVANLTKRIQTQREQLLALRGDDIFNSVAPAKDNGNDTTDDNDVNTNTTKGTGKEEDQTISSDINGDSNSTNKSESRSNSNSNDDSSNGSSSSNKNTSQNSSVEGKSKSKKKKKSKRLHWTAKKPIKTLQFKVTKDGQIIRKWALGEKTRYLIGREMGVVDVLLLNPTVSRKHAALVHGTPSGKPGVTLIDLKSGAGTYISKRLGHAKRVKVKSGEGVVLREGMCIHFGESTRTYIVEGLHGEPSASSLSSSSSSSSAIGPLTSKSGQTINPFRQKDDSLEDLSSRLCERRETGVAARVGVQALGGARNERLAGAAKTQAHAIAQARGSAIKRTIGSMSASASVSGAFPETTFSGQDTAAKRRHESERHSKKQASKRARLY